MRQALLDPAILAQISDADRFSVDAEQLVVPSAIIWVTLPSEQPALDLSTPVRSQLEQAKRLEVGERDVAAAGRVLAEVYADTSLTPRQKGWVGITLAWHAQRAGDTTLRDALLDDLDTAIDDPYRATIAGVILLEAVSGRPMAPWAVEAFGLLSEARAFGVIRRLRDQDCGDEAESLLRAYRPLARQRHILQVAGLRLAVLLAAGGPSIAVVGEETVLFYPGEAGSGRGAVLTNDRVMAILAAELASSVKGVGSTRPSVALVSGVANRSDSVSLSPTSDATTGTGLPEDARPVVEGLVGVVPQFLDVEKAGAVGLWSALIALALCFVIGMFMTVRVMRREAEAMRARADFLTSVTHELKTPLASLRLLSERLVEGRVKAVKLDKYYGLIASESSRLTVLIENVLDLGRMERGERSYDRRVQALGEIVHEAADLFAPLLQSDGFEFEVEVRDADSVAEVDRSALVQALVNVLENARKYAAEGQRVELRAGIDTGETGAGQLSRGQYLITVRDYGLGVPEAEWGRIFEQFERGARQKDGSVPGVGLGLYLARSILRAHGGELSCCAPLSAASPGGGAVFRFAIPLSDPSSSS